jgi:hypothetical protein
LEASKARVTKAGERLRAVRLGEDQLPPDDYAAERAIVETFRAEHAQPLTRVAAGLRYYVIRETGQHATIERPVGQRLKAMPTILDKLTRHPKMEWPGCTTSVAVGASCPTMTPSIE